MRRLSAKKIPKWQFLDFKFIPQIYKFFSSKNKIKKSSFLKKYFYLISTSVQNR